MTNVKIRNIEVVSGDKIINNDYFLEHFKKQDKDISHLLAAYGKNERKVISNEDTTISLGIKVAKKIMKSSGLTGDDIDMIVFSSQFPEYLLPTQSLIIHNAIGCKNKTMVMDSNVNCVGMLVAVDNAARYLKGNKKFKRALIIGSDYVTCHCDKSDELTYPMWGDSACAVILEKTEDDSDIIDSSYYTDSSQFDIVKYPKCGLSNIYNDDISTKDKKIFWTPFDGSFIGEYARKSTEEMLEGTDIKMEDIKLFCCSQFAKPIITSMVNAFKLPEEKFIYIGDQYGYTGTTSPFIALYEGIKQHKVKKGDYVVLWSVGTNWTTCALLIKL